MSNLSNVLNSLNTINSIKANIKSSLTSRGVNMTRSYF